MLRLIVIDKIAHAAKTVNEDLFGHNGQAAWILDGATGIAKDTIPGAHSDPQWLVETTSAELARVWDNDKPTRDLLLQASQNTIQRYNDLMGDNAPPLIERPTACLTLVRLWHGKLEISVVRDSGVLCSSNGEVLTFGCVSNPGANHIHDERDRLLKAGTLPEALHELMLPFHRQFRSKANVDGGYNIVDTTNRWVDRMKVSTIAARPSDRLLLLSDGFYRLIDVFQKYDASSLIEAAESRSLTSLYNELRQMEKQDRACTLFPRFKISDDVCAALIAVG